MTGCVVHAILERTPEAVARRVVEAPGAAALLEIRADALRAGDVAGLVRRAGRAVVVAVRSPADCCSFDGSVEEKSTILGAALRAGCAFVDVEWDGPLRDLADGPESSRTILSHHGVTCDAPALTAVFEAMAATRAARLKIVPRAIRPPELVAVRDLLGRARSVRRALACFAAGPAGVWSRVFALAWGSWGTYAAAAPGRRTGDGQGTTRDMLDVYRVLEISDATRCFALCGTPLTDTPSPALHAAAYRALGLDAVYVPLETGDLADVAPFVATGDLHPVSGLGVTIPLKEAVAKRCDRLDPFAACGSANTVLLERDEWEGFNTDAPAALALIRNHLEPRGRTVAIVGAGGTARAIAAALLDAGAFVTLFNRSVGRGDATAQAVGAASAPLTALARARWDILVQATPVGRNGEEMLSRQHLHGRMVLDAAYGSEPTPLARAARARGLLVADGFELLSAQAALQFERLTGRPCPREAMAAALESWRSSSFP